MGDPGFTPRDLVSSFYLSNHLTLNIPTSMQTNAKSAKTSGSLLGPTTARHATDAYSR